MGLYEEALQVLEEAEDHTYGADLVYCKAVTCFYMHNKALCLELLEEALMENYEQHKIMFDIAPELRLDKDIQSMIRYYAE
jgi:hypothetical protein